MIMCDLCEEREATELLDGDNLCTECYDGLVYDSMKIKTIKKDNNELIQTNFGTSIRKIFGDDSDK